jgi:hypothetical protein
MATNYLNQLITHSLIQQARQYGASDAFLAAARARIGKPIRFLRPGHAEWAACLFPHATLADGTQEWHHEGKRHREDGPAVIFPCGVAQWWREGRLHRADGPAVIYPDGREEYWVDGRPVARPA